MYFVKIQWIFFTLGLLYSVISANDDDNDDDDIDDVANHPNWNLIDRTNCGKNSLDDNSLIRIIGGKQTRMGMYPWMALIGRPIKNNAKKVSYYCGGSLINKNYVLTAAHCIKLGPDRQTSTVRLGEHDITKVEDCDNGLCAPPVQDFSPAEMIVHNEFVMNKMVDDIALIRLDRPAEISVMVDPICLPNSEITAKVGSFLKVAGWGIYNVHSDRSAPILLDVNVEILPFDKCNARYSQFVNIYEESQICAGGKVGYDSCAGDSGGPLMGEELVDGVYRYFQKGIVSYGDNECGSKHPAIYTRVNHYIQWILDNIRE